MYNPNEVKRIKQSISDAMNAALAEYEAEHDCVGTFENPLVSYQYSQDPIFDTLHMTGLCDHPAKVYRPGCTIITYFVPFSEHITESNRGGSEPSEEWTTAYDRGTLLVMRLNRAIRETLEANGRLISYLNTPADWNEKKARENWSHKTVAYISGLGKFSTAGCLVTEKGFGGRFSGMSTDGLLFDERAGEISNREAENVVNDILSSSYDFAASDECISACPCGAISKDGVDRFKCQEHCKTINEFVPSPDVCGKCFFYR